jgi:histidinol-phosphate aminotransferase
MNSHDLTSCSSISRRNFLRSASAVLAAGPILTEAHFAYAARVETSAVPEFSMKGIYIDANENPLGPSDAARKAIANIIPNGGRYAPPLYFNLMKIYAEQMGVPADHVMVYDGSSAPLHYTVLSFVSPSKSLVLGNPTYEAAQRAAEIAKAPIHAVPLAKDYSHDVHAMVKADPNAGLIYICNPNNPTGTITSKEDIDWLIANKPAGAVVLIDEAYIHLSDATSAIEHVKAGKDVVILRTFSKIYGMAGIRCGFAIGRPDLLKKLEDYGQSPMPITGMIAAQASLIDSDLVPTRKKIIADTRNDTFAWLKANNYSFIPSQSNCFMIDVKRPGPQIRQLMAQDGVHIGRSWSAWPTYVRVTVGLQSEMDAFKTSFKKAMDTPATAFNELLQRNSRGPVLS